MIDLPNLMEGMICRVNKAGNQSLAIWDSFKIDNPDLVCPCSITNRYVVVLSLIDNTNASLVMTLSDPDTLSVVWNGDLIPRIKDGSKSRNNHN